MRRETSTTAKFELRKANLDGSKKLLTVVFENAVQGEQS